MNQIASASRTCSECGEIIPPTLRVDHCPTCLLGLAIAAEPAEPLPPSAPGELFGDYELLELLGEGGMGVVYKARQRKLNRIVAVKLMRSGAFATPAETRRFRSEAQAAAQLTHPNVVAIHEVGEENGRPYFSMEFVEGQNLAQVIRRTPLAPERAANYVRLIADAIRYAHERGILHRDLKPANVLIDKSDRPRVTDFGLAKLIHSAKPDPNAETSLALTLPGAALGTPSYMPPEQAQGRHGEIGPASDVYSLGAILYDCLTGRPPFRADTPLDTLRQVVETEPAAPRLLNPKVPRDLETICLKCLAKEPDRRYASARELVEDLDRFLSGQPIHARPIGWLGRSWRWSRRNPALAGFGAVIAALLLMLAWAALLQREHAMVTVKEAASLTARLVDDELKPVKAAVAELSSNPELAQQMRQRDTNALKHLLQQSLSLREAPTPRWLRLQNWLVISPTGAVILRWPDAEKNANRECSVRDYFQGAMAGAQSESVYVSRAYQSVDDQQYKFALSKVVRGDDQNIIGVLALMVSPTDVAREAIGPRSAGREIVLVAEWDSSLAAPDVASLVPRGPREFRIVFHPTFGATNLVIPIDHPSFAQLSDNPGAGPLGDSFYRDPVARQQPKYRGWWLAGMARVPQSRLTVVYQTRDWVIDALALAGGATSIVAAALAIAWWTKRRRLRTQALPN